MTIRKADVQPATPEAIKDAAGLLRRGHLVAFPTETVYGLGANATDDTALARIFEAKSRPRFNPLIVHCADLEDIAAETELDERARAVAARFWPGPLTLVLRRKTLSRISALASAGLDTVAVRMPDHDIARQLIAAAGIPIAAPSANRSGDISPTRAAHVAASLGGRVAMILDGGPCRIGVESTVLDLSERTPALLRPGGIAREDIEAAIGPLAKGPEATGEQPRRSPGQMLRHYAPATPLRMKADAPREGEALLAFGARVPDGAVHALNLSPAGDLVEAAANLFAMLHELDAIGAEGIAVMPVPETGLGAAINDRLRRAARPLPPTAAKD